MTAPNPEKARAIMRREGFRWVVGQLVVNADGPVRIESVDGSEPGVLGRCRWTGDVVHRDIRSGPLVDYTDARTAEILDKIVPGWRGELDSKGDG